ncbi:hypothetical protein ARMSODRAFT_983582 [Armillaria solidipes]|uniref:Uncharacterized protein n=1 Tax=Armillaria solidipes TaxID=1076256 RepID=A0A2H3APR2_9AGAR|nr:hypothetical protein ARMSODRAFT_983582 [Armillaria solidipes]
MARSHVKLAGGGKLINSIKAGFGSQLVLSAVVRRSLEFRERTAARAYLPFAVEVETSFMVLSLSWQPSIGKERLFIGSGYPRIKGDLVLALQPMMINLTQQVLAEGKYICSRLTQRLWLRYKRTSFHFVLSWLEIEPSTVLKNLSFSPAPNTKVVLSSVISTQHWASAEGTGKKEGLKSKNREEIANHFSLHVSSRPRFRATVAIDELETRYTHIVKEVHKEFGGGLLAHERVVEHMDKRRGGYNFDE